MSKRSKMDMTVILDDLAAGRIDAAEAKRRIDALDQPAEPDLTPPVSTEWPLPPVETPPEEAPKAEPPTAEAPPKVDKINGVSKVLVRATGRKVRIVADPHVTTAAAEDVHQVKRTGSVLEIVGDKEFSGVVDALSWVKKVRGLDDVKALGIGQELIVRVNPTLQVDIDLTGSSLVVTDLPHIGKVRLTASVATINGVATLSDVLVQAGQATIQGRFTDGWSRIRCESGQVVVEIAAASDVVVRADAQLGRVTWDGITATEGEATLNHGTAHLDIGVVIGHAAVRVA